MMTFDELPLVFFTTLSQIAVGAFLFLTITEARESLEQKTVRFCACVIFLCAVLSMACSTAHLGDPAGGWRALLGLDHSWLSREILGINTFCGMVVLYFFFSARNAALHRFCGILGSVAGLLSILSTSLVYTLPSRPAWDSPFPLLFFLLTTFAAGPALLQFLLLQKKQAVQFPPRAHHFTRPACGHCNQHCLCCCAGRPPDASDRLARSPHCRRCAPAALPAQENLRTECGGTPPVSLGVPADCPRGAARTSALLRLRPPLPLVSLR